MNTFTRLALTGLLLLSVTAHARDPLNLLQSIPLPSVKGRFDHFSVDAKSRRLFVAALGNNSVEVIDLAAARPLHSIPGMSKPQGVLFLADRNELLIANGDAGDLKILDAANFKVKQTLPDMPDADNLRLQSHPLAAWVGYGDGVLAAVASGAQEPFARIKLPGHPESFRLESQGPRIFVNIPEAKQIAIVDATKHEILSKWPMKDFQANFPMDLDELDHRLFVGCRAPARLVIFHTENGRLVADIPISGDTDDLFYDAKRKRIYISCGEGFIDIVQQASPDNYHLIAKIPTAAGARTSFFSPELDSLYLGVPDRGSQKAEIRIYQPD